MGWGEAKSPTTGDMERLDQMLTAAGVPIRDDNGFAYGLLDRVRVALREQPRLLRERAESYSNDARRFRESGDTAMWSAYHAIAEELRKCADHAGWS